MPVINSVQDSQAAEPQVQDQSRLPNKTVLKSNGSDITQMENCRLDRVNLWVGSPETQKKITVKTFFSLKNIIHLHGYQSDLKH